MEGILRKHIGIIVKLYLKNNTDFQGKIIGLDPTGTIVHVQTRYTELYLLVDSVMVLSTEIAGIEHDAPRQPTQSPYHPGYRK
jgi:hypothetical protein